ncbi:MAG: putative DNA binding domain-containing protein [Bacteroidales bacterium]|nr:putative DNA binding domain-containing protein [Bacteroidales bacterium]
MSLSQKELIAKIQDIEWDDFEAKASRTQLPADTWRTVSAFSNTSGGWILFGVAQHGKNFEIEGIENGEKIENDFLTTIRNKDKFNHVLHCEAKKLNVDGKLLLAFYIPSSELKPIWFNTPKNTFIRSGSGDQQANDLEISAIYRDQAFGSQSEKPIGETSFEDINPGSFASYRKRVREENPGFFANDYDDETFCRVTGITKKGRLTYGGLLMFGRFDIVREHCPNFWVDYLEIPGTSYSDATVRYSYRMPELDNLWEYYRALIQRLRLHVDAAPFTTGPDGFSPDDESQLYALREGLVNLESHTDYFAPMHPTIRIFDNRIEFQNPGRFVRGLEHLRNTISSSPRNPNILKLFRYAKLSENAGYGINKIYSWERYTGEKVEFATDIMSTTVTYWRPKVGTTVKRVENSSAVSKETNLRTNPRTNPAKRKERGPELRTKMIRIMKATPTITRQELANLCGVNIAGIKYHLRILKDEMGIHWQGSSIKGHWVLPE